MATLTIPPTGTVTFTVIAVPRSEGGRKTLFRLMRLQASTRRILTKLQHLRLTTLNEDTDRGGRIWINRATCSRVAFIEAGKSFTIAMTPQIMKDVESVSECLKVA